ncbi:ABC transporter permease [Alkalibacter rhizosphaerae]|uniref:ABC transporter permease n=1 Tax=Alkalibacter rhizosphaerae TaxID=2815577 RepID=UPI001FF0636A|nr:ABC transporter permease [Alkalibacter rhizosphaerae]
MKILNKVTLKNLQKNKTRTLVTIIGIILSVSLFTAITTSVFSLQSYIIEVVKEQEGNYYGGVLNITLADRQALAEKEEVEALSSLEHVGYARLEGIQNEDKPYVFIGAMDEEFSTMMPVHLVDGVLPENSSQVLLPEHLSTNGGVTLFLGDTLTLNVGRRVYDGGNLTQTQSFLKGQEELVGEETKSYTVVGFYERPTFEGYTAPGIRRSLLQMVRERGPWTSTCGWSPWKGSTLFWKIPDLKRPWSTATCSASAAIPTRTP